MLVISVANSELFLVARLRVNEGSGRSSLKEEGKSQSTKQKFLRLTMPKNQENKNNHKNEAKRIAG